MKSRQTRKNKTGLGKLKTGKRTSTSKRKRSSTSTSTSTSKHKRNSRGGSPNKRKRQSDSDERSYTMSKKRVKFMRSGLINPSGPSGPSPSRPQAYRHTSKARFLSALCADAGVCLALGNLTEEIKEHFQGFTTFAYVVPPILRIGEDSNNGFINQIEYVHRGYKSYAILKSAKTAEADNLLYEYVVGQYINKLNKLYPCFLETYGQYQYVDDYTWTELQNPRTTDINILTQGLEQKHYVDYNNACRQSQKLAILIQYLKNIKSLYSVSREPLFIQDELLGALFQLYLPLARLKDTFTHYDLHLENVYLYQPVAGKYIQYHYYISASRAVQFKSSYLLKIIDYGRSFFRDDTGTNAKQIYEEELCEYAMDCNDPATTGKCGDNVGFSWLKKMGPQPAQQFYISSQKKNISHDLLPLKRIGDLHARDNRLTPELTGLLQKVIYTGEYGTAELTGSGYPHAIYNVEDAMKCIMAEMVTKKYQDHNEAANRDKTKLGDLYIYLDGRPMNFVVA
jgi:hypothetical protein